MKKIILSLFISLFLIACDSDKDADGIPKITSLDNITVDGQTMTAAAFFDEFCKLKPSNETCIAVDHQAFMDNNASAFMGGSNHKEDKQNGN